MMQVLNEEWFKYIIKHGIIKHHVNIKKNMMQLYILHSKEMFYQ